MMRWSWCGQSHHGRAHGPTVLQVALYCQVPKGVTVFDVEAFAAGRERPECSILGGHRTCPLAAISVCPPMAT